MPGVMFYGGFGESPPPFVRPGRLSPINRQVIPCNGQRYTINKFIEVTVEGMSRLPGSHGGLTDIAHRVGHGAHLVETAGQFSEMAEFVAGTKTLVGAGIKQIAHFVSPIAHLYTAYMITELST
jgi:hypothetical protein